MSAASTDGTGAPGVVPAAAPRKEDPAKKVRRRSLREDAVNLPNLLTMLRIVLIPVALYLIVLGTPASSFWAAMVYFVSAITDFFDGWLARRMGLESVLGKFLDPLADKLLVISSLVAMVAMDRVPAWVVILIVARELSITSLRVIAISEGVQIAAGAGGKWKAAIQMVAVFFLMLHYPFVIPLGDTPLTIDMNWTGLAVLYLSLVLALTSAGEYVKLFVDAVEQKEKRLAAADAAESETDPRP